jgi:hypothetical protein
VGRSTGRDAIEDGTTAADKEAQGVPQLEPHQAKTCGNQALTANCHCLRPVANKQSAGREAGKRPGEVCAADAKALAIIGEMF